MTETSKNNWLESRQSLITATDSLFLLKEFNKQLAPKLEGVNTWNRTRFQLYTEKIISVEKYIEYQNLLSTPTMAEGKNREAEIAEFAKSDLGLELTANGDKLSIKEEYKIGATPDYYCNFTDNFNIKDDIECNFTKQDIAIIDDTFGILECKLTYKLTDDKLLGYQLQVQQQLLCTGLKWAVIAVAVKESREVGSPIAKRHYHFIKANENLQQAIIDSAQEFWKWFDSVKEGKIEAPKADTANEKDKILNTFIEDDIAVLCEKYMELYIAYQAQDVSFDAIKARLKLCGKTESFNITTNDGTSYRIPITKRKDTIWTEELKAKEIKKIEEATIGSIKLKGSISIGKPEII